MSALANSPAVVIGAVIIALAVIAFGRRIDVKVGNVSAQLEPNGGRSLRDSVDRIEKKADRAVTRAEDAAKNAHFAAQSAAKALERIERIEQAASPTATAILVAPPAPDQVE